jgi:hypothetical protein
MSTKKKVYEIVSLNEKYKMPEGTAAFYGASFAPQLKLVGSTREAIA